MGFVNTVGARVHWSLDNSENEHLSNSHSCNHCSLLLFIIEFDKNSTFLCVCKAVCTNTALHIENTVIGMLLCSLTFPLDESIQNSKYSKTFLNKTVPLNIFISNYFNQLDVFHGNTFQASL